MPDDVEGRRTDVYVAVEHSGLQNEPSNELDPVEADRAVSVVWIGQLCP